VRTLAALRLLVARTAHLELQIEEMELHAGSTLVGQLLKASPVKSELGIIIVAIKKPDGKMLCNPTPETVFETGDMLITLGHRQQLDRLEKVAVAGR
jgi:voltage-gated potassium channel